MTPFEMTLGDRFHHLMPQLRQLHGGRAPVWRGKVTVRDAPGWVGRQVARVIGFPTAMDLVPMTITIRQNDDGSETWRRDFDGHALESKLWFDANKGGLQEKLGFATINLKPEVRADTLFMRLGPTRLFGRWVIPKRFAVTTDMQIWQDEAGRYRFAIKASMPVVGHIIRYEGWLRPEMQSGFVETGRR